MLQCLKNIVVFSVLLILEESRGAVRWEALRCSADTDQATPEGPVPDIGRFPWLGVIQHTFYLAGKSRFAITSAVLIHPAYAITSAEDIGRIQPEALANNTKFIIWRSRAIKYTLEVYDYFLHPDYVEDVTSATLALVQLFTLGETGAGVASAPVLPICMPVSGSGVFTDMYAVRMTDEKGELQKEMLKMNYVENQDCQEFYYKNGLHHKKMAPLEPVCASAAAQVHSCVWDAGAALITRQSWGHWKLLGFSARGPGCGAPARFLYVHRFLRWIDEVITRAASHTREADQQIVFRRVSPIKLIMYKAKTRIPKEQGQCDRKDRGHVLYKDNSEILVNKNFAQGFFFVSVAQLALINCAVVQLEVNSRTNAAVWVEHHCQQMLMGDRQGQFKDIRSRECFTYFSSTAYIEFRFYFSFRAMLEVTMYGTDISERFVPNPYNSREYTYAWVPTYEFLRTKWFMPSYGWWWYL